MKILPVIAPGALVIILVCSVACQHSRDEFASADGHAKSQGPPLGDKVSQFGYSGVSCACDNETVLLVHTYLRKRGIIGYVFSNAGGCQIQVPADRAAEARALCMELKASGHPGIFIEDWPPNKAGAGKGAGALLFHVGLLACALPDLVVR